MSKEKVIITMFLITQDATSIVSLVCGTNKIAWTHVDRGMTVLDWQQVECPNFLRGTYMASSYLTDVSRTIGVIKILTSRTIVLVLFLTFGWNSWYGIKTQECAICHFSFLPLGLHSCVTPPISRLLRNREILHLNPEYGSVPCHGSHEDCRGHAVRSA